jgi:hypothetical protein
VLVNLTELGLILGDRDACAVENDESSTRRTLVNGTNESVLQITRNLILVLQQRAVSIVLLLWSIIETGTSRTPLVVRMFFRELKITRGLRIPVHAIVVQFERVPHSVCEIKAKVGERASKFTPGFKGGEELRGGGDMGGTTALAEKWTVTYR